MSIEFHANSAPSGELLKKAAAIEPTNPVYTNAYAAARRMLGDQPWIFYLSRDGQIISACSGFMRKKIFWRSLTIPSLSTIAEEKTFWQGLLELCRDIRVTTLRVGSFASRGRISIPPLPNETRRRLRWEYILDLTVPELWKNLSSNHKRNIKRARKAGVEIRSFTEPDACSVHCMLMSQSMLRRNHRGEAVPQKFNPENSIAHVQSGSGVIFQAFLKGKAVSSILILLSEKGAYYQSAGTSPEGMACGASHLLVYEIVQELKNRSIERFSLGGADKDTEGLQRFKTGFGAREIELSSAEAFFGGMFMKRLIGAARYIRRDPLHSYRLFASVEHFVVYSSDTHNIATPDSMRGITFEKLPNETLLMLSKRGDELRKHAERLQKFGFNDAYGLYCNGKLAHISWMVTADHDQLLPVRNVKLRDCEAEITHCLTLPEFRGRGLYPYAIRRLCIIAKNRGTKRIFLITSVKNKASRRGIEKAGLLPHGKIFRFKFPWLPKVSLTFRGHRILRRP